MNRDYEALVILRVVGTEADVAHSVKQLEEPIQKLSGQIDSSVSWGRRRLAYRIARQTEGLYHLVQFHMPPSRVDELKRLLRLNETIVRFLILSRAEHVAAPSATAAQESSAGARS